MKYQRRYRGESDQRSAGQKDRDRILYSSALKRLAGVTQVVSADEGHVLHNRLTHTLEVAQIARRLAERLVSQQADVAEALGGLDPDLAEAAALAHDLGHPPFGHSGEEELKALGELVAFDAFEGNAQSFRILVRLACRYVDSPGLDLTRGTLNAVLKYPWFREPHGGKKTRKFGCYRSEEADFSWARELGPEQDCKSLEAEVMDLADDIAYAVHDVEDFYRARLIPLELLRSDPTEIADFVNRVQKRWDVLGKEVRYSNSQLEGRCVSSQMRHGCLEITEQRAGSLLLSRAG